jgi:hypothetical protein
LLVNILTIASCCIAPVFASNKQTIPSDFCIKHQTHVAFAWIVQTPLYEYPAI